MANYDLITDLQTITTIPMTSLQKLEKKSIALLCDFIDSSERECDSTTSVDIGIGKLIFDIDTDKEGNKAVSYRFIPSLELERNIVSTIQDGESPLVKLLDGAIAKQILTMYKDLM